MKYRYASISAAAREYSQRNTPAALLARCRATSSSMPKYSAETIGLRKSAISCPPQEARRKALKVQPRSSMNRAWTRLSAANSPQTSTTAPSSRFHSTRSCITTLMADTYSQA
ncbi:hypothetical protein D3C76_535410 [compost metagenome]